MRNPSRDAVSPITRRRDLGVRCARPSGAT
jgi:hypothetical protein